MKRELRKRYINLRKTFVSDAQRQALSRVIAEKVLVLDALKRAKNIFCYSAYAGEVETDLLIDSLLKLGKKVYLPLCDKNTNTMSARRIKSRDELTLGAYGILEPSGEEIKPQDVDFVVVPMVAFDRNRTRLGYGGGYYDRYLPNTDAVTCGIAFSVQEAEGLPRGEYDIPLDMIITEKEIIE